MAFVLNARDDQFSEDGRILTAPVFHEIRLIAVIGEPVLLYRPRDLAPAGYIGVAQIADVLPSKKNSHLVDVLFDYVQLLTAPVSLKQMNALTETPQHAFHRYAKMVRRISDLAYATAVDALPNQRLHAIIENYQRLRTMSGVSGKIARIRNRHIRNLMFRLHGDSCLFCGNRTTDLTGRLVETTVAHIVPLHNGGPDNVQNTLPLCRRCHFLLDQGVVSLTDAGEIVIARSITPRPTLLPRLNFHQLTTWPRLECMRWHRDHIFEKGPSKAQFGRSFQQPYRFE